MFLEKKKRERIDGERERAGLRRAMGLVPVLAGAGSGGNIWCQDIEAVVLGQV